MQNLYGREMNSGREWIAETRILFTTGDVVYVRSFAKYSSLTCSAIESVYFYSEFSNDRHGPIVKKLTRYAARIIRYFYDGENAHSFYHIAYLLRIHPYLRRDIFDLPSKFHTCIRLLRNEYRDIDDHNTTSRWNFKKTLWKQMAVSILLLRYCSWNCRDLLGDYFLLFVLQSNLSDNIGRCCLAEKSNRPRHVKLKFLSLSTYPQCFPKFIPRNRCFWNYNIVCNKSLSLLLTL